MKPDATSRLGEMLSNPGYLMLSAAIFAVSLPLFFITSGVFEIPSMELNPTSEPLLVGIVVVIALLLSLNVSAILYGRQRMAKPSGKFSVLGAFAGLFTTTCSVCPPAWLLWLGAGSLAGFLADISTYLGIASAAMLAISLHHSLKQKHNICGVEK